MSEIICSAGLQKSEGEEDNEEDDEKELHQMKGANQTIYNRADNWITANKLWKR